MIQICLWVSIHGMFAQKQYFDSLNRNQYLAKVKLMDEFFARFNGDEVRPNLTKKYADRKSNILFLFDLSKFKSKADKNFKLAEKFAKEVADSNYCLRFESPKWDACVKCHGTLNGKQVSFLMHLVVEERDSSNMYKWAIANVEGDIFKTSKDRPHKNLFVMPNDHEQFFASIRKISTEAYRFVDDYMVDSYKTSALSVFATLVRNGALKIDYVSDLHFIFSQVPNYKFVVKYFDRESENAGWLIDSVKSCDNVSETN